MKIAIVREIRLNNITLIVFCELAALVSYMLALHGWCASWHNFWDSTFPMPPESEFIFPGKTQAGTFLLCQVLLCSSVSSCLPQSSWKCVGIIFKCNLIHLFSSHFIHPAKKKVSMAFFCSLTYWHFFSGQWGDMGNGRLILFLCQCSSASCCNVPATFASTLYLPRWGLILLFIT